MLNFFIRKVALQNGDTRYRSVITRSGKSIKSKTFRRKSDAKTWINRSVLDYQEYEAKGKTLIPFSRLAVNTCNAGQEKTIGLKRLVIKTRYKSLGNMEQ